jgi:predicted dehydrogenase
LNILIIGLGSIGKKHLCVIYTLYPLANIFALRSKRKSKKYENVINIYSIEQLEVNIDFVIISTPTYLHENDIIKFSKLGCPLFIEKPVLHDLKNIESINSILISNNIKTYVACNMRFHPGIVHLKNFIANNNSKINEVNVYFGSYMPNWRNGIDFRENYSSHDDMGGGVHLDLIHEIDYCIWIFGYPKSIKSFFRKVSNLEINSIDYTNYILFYDDFTLNIKLNYYRIDSKREIEILTNDTTLIYDLIQNKVYDNKSKQILYHEDFSMMDTYNNQMKYFIENINNNQKTIMNNFEESIKILKIALNDKFE